MKFETLHDRRSFEKELYENGASVSNIAELLGKSTSTIYRDLKKEHYQPREQEIVVQEQKGNIPAALALYQMQDERGDPLYSVDEVLTHSKVSSDALYSTLRQEDIPLRGRPKQLEIYYKAQNIPVVTLEDELKAYTLHNDPLIREVAERAIAPGHDIADLLIQTPSHEKGYRRRVSTLGNIVDLFSRIAVGYEQRDQISLASQVKKTQENYQQLRIDLTHLLKKRRATRHLLEREGIDPSPESIDDFLEGVPAHLDMLAFKILESNFAYKNTREQWREKLALLKKIDDVDVLSEMLEERIDQYEKGENLLKRAYALESAHLIGRAFGTDIVVGHYKEVVHEILQGNYIALGVHDWDNFEKTFLKVARWQVNLPAKYQRGLDRYAEKTWFKCRLRPEERYFWGGIGGEVKTVAKATFPRGFTWNTPQLHFYHTTPVHKGITEKEPEEETTWYALWLEKIKDTLSEYLPKSLRPVYAKN